MATYTHPVNQDRSDQGGLSYPSRGTLAVSGGGSDAAGAATKYLTSPGGTHAAAQVALICVPEGYTNIHSLEVVVATAPAGTDTYVVTVQKSTTDGASYADTTLTCTVTGTDKDAYDRTNVPSVAAGDLLAIKVVSSAGTAAAATATFVVS